MPTYFGTDGRDNILGGLDADIIYGRGGNDTLGGGGGDDQIYGEDGNDTLNGGDGSDLLDGGDGNDFLNGGSGLNTLRGGGGDDRIIFTGYNSLTGASIDGGTGIDTLQFDGSFMSSPIVFSVADPSVTQYIGGAPVVNMDTLSFRGGSGNDTITGGALTDYVDGSEGDDVLDGGLGDDTLDGGSGTNTLYGGGGDDTLRSSGIGDKLYGGTGNDMLFWNPNGVLFDGGDGIDTLRISLGNAGYTVDVSNPSAEIIVQGTRITGIDKLIVYTGSGNDHLTGGAFDDVLDAGAGDDVLIGGAGNDTLAGGEGADLVSGGSGDDSILSYSQDVNLADMFDGGDGYDTLNFQVSNSTAAITIDLSATSGWVTNIEQIFFSARGTGTNHVSGGAFADTLFGWSGADYFDGRDGDDRIDGYGGGDTLLGGGGDDYISSGTGSNTLSGGDGNDILLSGDGIDILSGDAGDDSLNGGQGADMLYGGSGNDRLEVGWGGNGTIVDGGADSDTLVVTDSVLLGGLSGIEAIDLQYGANLTLTDSQFNGLALGTVLSGTGTITVNMAPDQFLFGSTLAVAAGSSIAVVFNGSSGNDYVKAVSQATNTMLGGDGNDFLRGGQLADVIDGGAGGDKITGFGGADTLTGGGGADQFRYLTQNDSGLGVNADHITDFTVGTDRLNFQLFDGDTNTPDLQNPGFSFLGNTAFHATGAAEIRYEASGADMVVQVDVNGDGVTDMAIYLNGLGGGVLTGADFML